MAWVGRGSITYKMGRAATFVRVGKYAIPRQMTFTFVGADRDPDLVAELSVRDGRPQCVSVTISAKDHGRPVRTSDMEAWVRIDTMVAHMFARESHHVVEDRETGVTQMTPIMDDREFWRAINEVDTAVRAPRRASTRAELEQVARIYQDNVNSQPVEQVRTLMGYGSLRTAARRVKDAENEGLLPPTSPGKRRRRNAAVSEMAQPVGDSD